MKTSKFTEVLPVQIYDLLVTTAVILWTGTACHESCVHLRKFGVGLPNDLGCLLAVAILWNVPLHHYLDLPRILWCKCKCSFFSFFSRRLCHLNLHIHIVFLSSAAMLEEDSSVAHVLPRVAPQNKESSKKVVTAGRKASHLQWLMALENHGP